MWKKPIVWIPALLIAIAAVSTIQWSEKAEADVNLKAPRAITWSDFLGVNAQFEYFDASVYQKQMAALDALGLTWVRLAIHWAIIEPTQGNYNIAALDGAMTAMSQHKYNIVAYLVGSAPFASSAPAGATNTDQYPPSDYNLFANRMTLLAQRYPQVNTWQVWNEPNIFWLPAADPVAYGSLMTTTANAIRAVLPDKNIGTAGMAYYSQMQDRTDLILTDLVDQGLASQNIIAAYHPYSAYPEGDDTSAMDFIKRSNTLNSTLHAKGVTQVWADEWGWSSYAGPVEMQAVIGTDGQADYTLRRLALMSAMDFQRIFLFNLNDLDARASARDQYYGLIDLNGDPKPVYTALKYFLGVTGSHLEPADPPTYTNGPGDLFNVAWTRADGTHLWLIWSASGASSTSSTASASVTLPSVTSATLFDPLQGTSSTLANDQGITVPLKTSLQMLVW